MFVPSVRKYVRTLPNVRLFVLRTFSIETVRVHELQKTPCMHINTGKCTYIQSSITLFGSDDSISFFQGSGLWKEMGKQKTENLNQHKRLNINFAGDSQHEERLP